MKITTKTGDKGETSLFGGRRVSKASEFIRMVGELDELQAVIGWCRVAMKDDVVQSSGVVEAAGAICLSRIEDDLYRMMSIVGFEFKCPGNIKPIGEEDVEFLEKEMSKYGEVVGDLSKFVRPGGSEISARLHIARTVCRRVERGMVKKEELKVVKMTEDKNYVPGNVNEIANFLLKYLNRLSDLLFVLAYRFEKEA